MAPADANLIGYLVGGCRGRPVSAIHAKPQAHAPPQIEIARASTNTWRTMRQAARSDGQANGNLARAVPRPRREQAAQVGAGGQQHNAGQ